MSYATECSQDVWENYTAIAPLDFHQKSNPKSSKTLPKFNKNQIVAFIGGVGVIKNLHHNSRTWTYIVEMELGPEPEMGRIGSETRILLPEMELEAA